jgi:anti-sigma B factor antagonist
VRDHAGATDVTQRKAVAGPAARPADPGTDATMPDPPRVVPHLTIAAHVGADRARLHLCGELDMEAADALLDHFARAVAGWNGSLLLIDVAELTFCDSCGIRALLIIAGRCHADGTRFRVVGANGVVRRIFELTDTVELLNA